ncbi:MAG TPA: polyprenyl synthetase family protein [Bacteroidia bacterium]|nr:polyprenyl synthetase family protein [Bacteroidia bacterium]HND72477.1 polyprenyl synthetase family protein [Bacteroidia bacterium]HNF31963.1 polyprenyl synthetase family protein [Bacteroidia bacterium]HNN11776.1 polyprenyl synthetase family protein [Bacteroidia bacterium]HRF16134.1 polyprenyl synthetase family protein [Bacteroidia bacterium]
MESIDFLQREIEYEIKSLHFGHEPANLYQPMEYIVELGGKRMRPLLVLIGAGLFEANYQKAMKAAIGIELFHNFTLLHDDIMDKATLRRNKPTVHEKWTADIAILSGDALFVRASEYIMQVDDAVLRPVMQLFYKTAMQVCEGQQYDMDFGRLREITPEDYIGMITLKTAVLPACCLATGAIIAKASEEDKLSLYEFGKNIGIAFQIQDDLLDAFGDDTKFGKRPGGDIIEGKKTFLFSEACRLLNGKEHLDFLTLYNSHNLSNHEKITAVMQVFNNLELHQHTMRTIQTYYQKGLAQLAGLNVQAKNVLELKLFCEKLLIREH